MPTLPPVIDRDSALAFLLGRINYERTTHIPYRESEFKLDRMRQLLAMLGNPQGQVPALHIAGTKGKGSTAAMADAALTAAGYRTGLYTSPHLSQLEERFAIDGQMCGEVDFVALASTVAQVVAQLDEHPQIENRGATFFEVTTAMGFLHFARKKVDVAVLEVGLGGRLDSTNVCLPLACAVTSISYDHMTQLGNTLAEIAAEKAGIAKAGVPLVCNVLEAEAREVIHRVASAARAPLWQLGSDYGFEDSARGELRYWDRFEREPFELDQLSLAMPGAHQSANAACAIALLRQLPRNKWRVTTAAIREGLGKATCPARVEVLSRDPLVIMDAAHNVASIAALLETLDRMAPASKRLLIFGTTRDKDAAGMLRLLLPRFQHILFTRYVNNPRAVEPAELNSLANQLLPTVEADVILEAQPTPALAWGRAEALSAAYDLRCITGSFFLAAELRSLVCPPK